MFATSCAVPIRFIGCASRSRSDIAGRRSRRLSHLRPSTRIGPGDTVLARMPGGPALRQLSHVVDRHGLQRAIAGTDGDIVGLNAAPGHAQLLQRRRVDECATRRCCLPAVGLLAHIPQRSRPDQQALGGDHTVGVRGSSRGVRTSSGGPGMERIVGIATEHRIESGRCRRREPAPHIIRRWTGRPSS